MSDMFQVGDFVRLKTGSTKMKVIAVYPDISGDTFIEAEYVKSKYTSYASCSKFTKWINDLNPNVIVYSNDYNPKIVSNFEKENKNMLYVTKNEGEKLYGTFLAKDSEGRLVLEMKNGVDKIKAFDVSEVEEVLPYTIKVKALFGREEKHVSIKENSVKVGDLLFVYPDYFYIVKELNTKYKSAEEFKGVKLVTEKIDV
jgi:hypothetical protein